MHFEITKEVLLHSLLQIYKILPPKTLFPIFHYIKIKALDNVCYLEAMDYNKNIQLQMLLLLVINNKKPLWELILFMKILF
ncbi:hypothetical protein ACGRWE_00015 [Candidatus Phytoplasma australasiaticum]